jgi:hypothetical protein
VHHAAGDGRARPAGGVTVRNRTRSRDYDKFYRTSSPAR